MEITSKELIELQSLIGINEELTENVMYRVMAIPPSHDLLSIYSTLLLERFENTIPLIEKVMKEKLDQNFINLLQSSRFYYHRMAVPLIIKNLSFFENKFKG